MWDSIFSLWFICGCQFFRYLDNHDLKNKPRKQRTWKKYGIRESRLNLITCWAKRCSRHYANIKALQKETIESCIFFVTVSTRDTFDNTVLGYTQKTSKIKVNFERFINEDFSFSFSEDWYHLVGELVRKKKPQMMCSDIIHHFSHIKKVRKMTRNAIFPNFIQNPNIKYSHIEKLFGGSWKHTLNFIWL